MKNTRQYQHKFYNWEYAREKILADNYVSIFNSHAHSKQLFELELSIANIISETKETPEVYLVPTWTSINNRYEWAGITNQQAEMINST